MKHVACFSRDSARSLPGNAAPTPRLLHTFPGNIPPLFITVTTTGGTSGAQVFTVNAAAMAPTLISISPGSGAQGSVVPVTLTGTNFVAGATVMAGWPVVVSNVLSVSATQITATFTIATLPANVEIDTVYVTVTTAAGTSGALAFTVDLPAPVPMPDLTSVSPASGARGSVVPVTLTGTDFVAGATVAVSNPGVAVSNVVVVSATQITATFTIGTGAALGAADVTVTTTGGTSGAVTFTVTSAP